jgi:hypothetical protein
MTGKTPHDNLPDRRLIALLKKLRQDIRRDGFRLCKA